MRNLDLDLLRVLVLVRNYMHGEYDIACVLIGSQIMHPLEPILTIETLEPNLTLEARMQPVKLF